MGAGFRALNRNASVRSADASWRALCGTGHFEENVLGRRHIRSLRIDKPCAILLLVLSQLLPRQRKRLQSVVSVKRAAGAQGVEQARVPRREGLNH